jgi:WXG100 family type VII secretion target
MASGYNVQQETMAKGAQAVDSATEQINGHLQRLDTEVQTMFGGWKGNAQRAFGDLHANWVGQQQKLQTALRDMHEALVKTGQTYNAQEENQAGAFTNIAGQL